MANLSINSVFKTVILILFLLHMFTIAYTLKHFFIKALNVKIVKLIIVLLIFFSGLQILVSKCNLSFMF
jgi:hypothetical protein